MSVTKKDLNDYLHQHIPITKALGVSVDHASQSKVVLSAPFANNINHKNTVFGGSLHAVATLACWSLLYLTIQETMSVHCGAQIVISRSEVDYLSPVDSDFTVECSTPESSEWQRFSKALQLKGKARIMLSATIMSNDRVALKYLGTFVAIIKKI